jgi:hypothetical protein
MVRKCLTIILLSLAMSGCWSTSPAVVGLTKPASEIKRSDEVARKNSQLAASIEAAGHANDSNVEGPAKTATGRELGFTSTLLNITPTPEDRLAALERVNVSLAGDVAAAEQRYLKASAAAVNMNAGLATLEAQIAKDRAADVQRGQQLLAAKDAQIADLKNRHSKNLQVWTSRGLVGVGGLGLGLTGFMIYGAVSTGGLMGLKKAAGCAVTSLLLIGCGFVVGHRYFLPAVIATFAVGGVSLFVYFHHIRKTGQLENKMRNALEDTKEEAKSGVVAAQDAWDVVSEHLKYRLPRPANGQSDLEKEIDRRLVAEGVVTT